MESAKASLTRIETAVANLKYLLQTKEQAGLTEEALFAGEEAVCEEMAASKAKFEQVMDDDFNSADAITAIFELVKTINTSITAESSYALMKQALDNLLTLTGILGIVVEKKEELLDEEIEQLIEERKQARKAKNFARADEIRQELLEKGIVLEDTREGVKWKRA